MTKFRLLSSLALLASLHSPAAAANMAGRGGRLASSVSAAPRGLPQVSGRFMAAMAKAPVDPRLVDALKAVEIAKESDAQKTVSAVAGITAALEAKMADENISLSELSAAVDALQAILETYRAYHYDPAFPLQVKNLYRQALIERKARRTAESLGARSGTAAPEETPAVAERSNREYPRSNLSQARVLDRALDAYPLTNEGRLNILSRMEKLAKRSGPGTQRDIIQRLSINMCDWGDKPASEAVSRTLVNIAGNSSHTRVQMLVIDRLMHAAYEWGSFNHDSMSKVLLEAAERAAINSPRKAVKGFAISLLRNELRGLPWGEKGTSLKAAVSRIEDSAGGPFKVKIPRLNTDSIWKAQVVLYDGVYIDTSMGSGLVMLAWAVWALAGVVADFYWAHAFSYFGTPLDVMQAGLLTVLSLGAGWAAHLMPTASVDGTTGRVTYPHRRKPKPAQPD